jgi:protocatechuate 3,4-dioxygenase beta subunit
MKKDPVKRIASLLTRREILGFIGGTGIVSLWGCWRGQSASVASKNAPTQAITVPSCVVKPEQTEGPYFVDEKLNRSDIRFDPSDGSVRPGVPLRLVFQVSEVRDRACTPLQGAIVDIWHCDAEGIYSDVRDPRFNTIGKKFLRGYQVTNSNGTAEFITIYPGWYPGRAVHIHFKIRTDSASEVGNEFTSQLYFDDNLSDRVHAKSPYAKPGQRTQNDRDGIFEDGGKELTLQLTSAKEGYVGRFNIGLKLS